MNVWAIDPGTRESGWVIYDSDTRQIQVHGIESNESLLKSLTETIRHEQGTVLAIEMIAAMGMSVGESVFETVRWIGRFQQAWGDPENVRFLKRNEVKIHICGTTKAKDKNIRVRLIDIVGEQGCKASPGPTYGIRSHEWSALAVAITAAETK
jgi:Holliday junction resolvasome RuvABC endonuclease subunit